MGYSNIPFSKFLFGLLILTLPAVVMNELGYEGFVYAYVFLILLMFAVYQSKGLGSFAGFVGSV